MPYPDPWIILQHGAYVAFAFSVLLFGALAFRQVLDNLELRRRRSGEDLLLLYSAPGILLSALGVMATVGVGMICYSIQPPTVFRYALPLVGGVQMTQILLRLHFQRTRVRTLALVVCPIVRSSPVVIPYVDMTGVELSRELLWTTVRVLHTQGEPVAFRIFTFQRARLEQRLRLSSTATILSKTSDHSR
ncbi:MAG: hypothetical protein RIR53_1286 [Bacteroidota bacterium]|jgi:hypothetical protein